MCYAVDNDRPSIDCFYMNTWKGKDHSSEKQKQENQGKGSFKENQTQGSFKENQPKRSLSFKEVRLFRPIRKNFLEMTEKNVRKIRKADHLRKRKQKDVCPLR